MSQTIHRVYFEKLFIKIIIIKDDINEYAHQRPNNIFK